MGFKEYLIAGVLLGAFIIAIIQGYGSLASNNDATNLLLQNEQVNSSYVQYIGNLSTLEGTTNASKTAFETENPSFTAGFLLFGSIISAVKNFTSAFVGIFIIFFQMISVITGISPLILSIFSAILIIILIFTAWRLYKLGE